MNLRGDLAESWQNPDPLTYIFHLWKPPPEEQARVIGAALQEQWRKVGIDLELRPLELATILSDAGRGNFQLTYARWVGAHNDPDIFEYVFSTKRFPPDGANRGHYGNPRIDALTGQIHVESNQEKNAKPSAAKSRKSSPTISPNNFLWFTDVSPSTAVNSANSTSRPTATTTS
jgi:ABC-type transport system substrate-binding protein